MIQQHDRELQYKLGLKMSQQKELLQLLDKLIRNYPLSCAYEPREKNINSKLIGSRIRESTTQQAGELYMNVCLATAFNI
jgi:hypothetical protein